MVADLIEVQTRLIRKLEDMTALLTQRDNDIVTLKNSNLKGPEEGPGGSESLHTKK